jgi:hypothetical protein
LLAFAGADERAGAAAFLGRATSMSSSLLSTYSSFLPLALKSFLKMSSSLSMSSSTLTGALEAGFVLIGVPFVAAGVGLADAFVGVAFLGVVAALFGAGFGFTGSDRLGLLLAPK